MKGQSSKEPENEQELVPRSGEASLLRRTKENEVTLCREAKRAAPGANSGGLKSDADLARQMLFKAFELRVVRRSEAFGVRRSAKLR